MFGLEWYDFIFLPWAVSKAVYNGLRGRQRGPDVAGRVPQSAAYGRAITLLYGKTRITSNIIYWEPVGEMVRTVVALCEGPIVGVDRVWRDRDMQTIDVWGWDFEPGNRPTATAWVDLPAGKDLSYPGIALVHPATGALLKDWAGAGMGQASFEVKGFLHATGDATNGDADPAQILSGASSVLTNTDYGAGAPWSVVVATGRDGNAASSYSRYATAEGLWISPAWTERKSARDMLQEVLDETNATCLWAMGALEIVPLGDQSVTGNSVTYTPATTIQYALTADDFLAQDDGRLLEIEAAPVAEVYNLAPVEFLERAPAAAVADPANAYNRSVVEDGDPSDILALRGAVRGPSITLDGICQRPTALKIARLRAQRAVRARNRYRFRLPWRFARLEPLDFVTIEDKLLGLTPAITVRIESIEEDPESYELDVEAVEWPLGTGGVVAHNTQSSDSVDPGTSTYRAEVRLHEVAASNWSVPTIPSAWPVSLAAGGGNIVAVGAGTNTAIRSTDGGLRWSTVTTPPGANMNSVTWAAPLGLFVAVGSSACYSSPTGDVWTSRTIPAGNYQSIGWNGTEFVAVGLSGAAARSTNGTTWAAAATPPSGTFRSVAWHSPAALWIAVGDSGACYTSPTGNVWSARTIPNVSYTGVTSNGTIAVAVGGASGQTAFSYDGITWTAGSSGTKQRYSVAWDGVIFAAGGDTNSRVATSPDGLAWVERDYVDRLSLPANSWFVCWTGTRWVAAGYSAGGIAASQAL